MTENTKIQWATHSWSPWVGCTKVSTGCDHCYAETWAKRTGADVWGHHKARRRTSAAYWRKPLQWEREASRTGVRPRVFPSLCDPFDAEADAMVRLEFLSLVKLTPHLDWLLLTKRPNLVPKMVYPSWLDGDWPGNLWLGTSVETRNQRWRLEKLHEVSQRVERGGGRIPVLFGSFEPLLEDLGLDEPVTRLVDVNMCQVEPPTTPEAGAALARLVEAAKRMIAPSYADLVDCGIFGGESGGGARPCNIQWIRNGRDALHAVGKAVFVKQIGNQPVVTCGGCLRLGPEDARAAGFDPLCLRAGHPLGPGLCPVIDQHDPKGGDMADWPGDLRVREFPEVGRG